MVFHEYSHKENKFCASDFLQEHIDTSWSFDCGEGSQECHNILWTFEVLCDRIYLAPAVDKKKLLNI